MHQIEQVSLCSHLIHSVRLHLFNTEEVTKLTGFPRTQWLWRQFSESHGLGHGLPWKCCEFTRFVLKSEQWPICWAVVRPGPSGAGRMITSKPSLGSDFDFIIIPAPSGPGRTPSQIDHYPLNVSRVQTATIIERHTSCIGERVFYFYGNHYISCIIL